MVVRGQLVCIGSVSQVLNVVRGQWCRFCESGDRDSWVCIGSVSQVLNGGEGTVGYVSVL